MTDFKNPSILGRFVNPSMQVRVKKSSIKTKRLNSPVATGPKGCFLVNATSIKPDDIKFVFGKLLSWYCHMFLWKFWLIPHFERLGQVWKKCPFPNCPFTCSILWKVSNSKLKWARQYHRSCHQNCCEPPSTNMSKWNQVLWEVKRLMFA